MTHDAQGTPRPESMTPEAAANLAEFARAAKAAARSVSLYPATHPAIQASLGRVVSSSAKLAATGFVTLLVKPDTLAIDSRAPARPDQAIVELADMLHNRLVGTLRIERAADAGDWHAFLLLVARAAEELIAHGGIAKAWAESGRAHFEIGEIDYAEVLRERRAGDEAAWDNIIEHCLRSTAVDLDEETLAGLLELAADPARFGDFLARLQESGPPDTKVSTRAAALLRILRGLVKLASKRGPDDVDSVLKSMAQASARLTPDMMLALLAEREGGTEGDGPMVGQIVNRMNDRTIASFVASNIVAERGATGRLAQALEALVPDLTSRTEVLELARGEVAASSMGEESGFEELWQNAATMLMNYQDKPYVAADYARELSGARSQAIEVDRVSDDPPERIQEWLSSVTAEAVRHLDLQLLLDLLRLEGDPMKWRDLVNVVSGEIERLTLAGDAQNAQRLLEPVTKEATDEGRPEGRVTAAAALERLSAGPLLRHVVLHLRKVEEREVKAFNALCHTLGPSAIRPLAEALATEENNRALRRLRELLLGFGAAGRQSVEQLKNSSNPAVRRTAIDLLRVFGGSEALPELASMLDDKDPQVQRESIRAIVQIGTDDAYAVLERALVDDSRGAVLQQLISLRDDKAIPLLCYVLKRTSPRGKLVNVHLAIIDALGGLSAHPESTETLTAALYHGNWWAPFRTATLRRAAATALRRIGGPEAAAVLEQAAASGPRGVRNAARAQVGMVRTTAPRERIKS
jgi:HEAT repeat protein